MSKNERAARALRECVAEYAQPAPAAVVKLSVRLPADLAETVRLSARDSGVSASAVIAAALRRAFDTAEQDRIDDALEAQNEENLEWSRAYVPVAASVWAETGW